jgi:heme/copper-type cytochrome/quinol oxidase subunit 2
MKHVNKLVPMLLVALVAAVGLAACGSSSDESSQTSGGAATTPSDEPESASMGGQVPTIVIRNGEPVGGIKELEYNAGDEIRFEVTSDVADEVHVHGYDLMKDVPAGGTVSFDFPAEIEGIFEAELEDRKEQILELRVNP